MGLWNGALQAVGEQDLAEGWAFTRGILPQVDKCNASAALELKRLMDIERPVVALPAGGFQAVQQAVQSVYKCMGISCGDVGVLLTGTSFVPGCADPLALYYPQINITDYARIDLDQREFAALLDAGRFDEARQLYETGKYSRKPSGELRTLKGFSTGISGSKDDAPLYQQFVAYYNSTTYAHDFVQAALMGTGPFVGKTAVVRAESAAKGAAYGSTWMYLVLEMYEALDNCDAGLSSAALQHWDEAWAFYAGSLEGWDGRGDGVQPFSLAEKRCRNFATCTGANRTTGEAEVNRRLRRLFQAGQTLLVDGRCAEARATALVVEQQMAVPLIQGMLRYAYRRDSSSGMATRAFFPFPRHPFPWVPALRWMGGRI